MTPHPACAGCGTTTWRVRRGGTLVERYRGEPFGLDGWICPTCRSRLVRHQRAIAEGREPRKPGRPATNLSALNVAAVTNLLKSKAPRERPNLVKDPTPRQLATRVRKIRTQQEEIGLRPRTGETRAEARQKRWAELAMAERRAVVESRQPFYLVRNGGAA